MTATDSTKATAMALDLLNTKVAILEDKLNKSINVYSIEQDWARKRSELDQELGKLYGVWKNGFEQHVNDKVDQKWAEIMTQRGIPDFNAANPPWKVAIDALTAQLRETTNSANFALTRFGEVSEKLDTIENDYAFLNTKLDEIEALQALQESRIDNIAKIQADLPAALSTVIHKQITDCAETIYKNLVAQLENKLTDFEGCNKKNKAVDAESIKLDICRSLENRMTEIIKPVKDEIGVVKNDVAKNFRDSNTTTSSLNAFATNVKNDVVAMAKVVEKLVNNDKVYKLNETKITNMEKTLACVNTDLGAHNARIINLTRDMRMCVTTKDVKALVDPKLNFVTCETIYLRNLLNEAIFVIKRIRELNPEFEAKIPNITTDPILIDKKKEATTVTDLTVSSTIDKPVCEPEAPIDRPLVSGGYEGENFYPTMIKRAVTNFLWNILHRCEVSVKQPPWVFLELIYPKGMTFRNALKHTANMYLPKEKHGIVDCVLNELTDLEGSWGELAACIKFVLEAPAKIPHCENDEDFFHYLNNYVEYGDHTAEFLSKIAYLYTVYKQFKPADEAALIEQAASSESSQSVSGTEVTTASQSSSTSDKQTEDKCAVAFQKIMKETMTELFRRICKKCCFDMDMLYDSFAEPVSHFIQLGDRFHKTLVYHAGKAHHTDAAVTVFKLDELDRRNGNFLQACAYLKTIGLRVETDTFEGLRKIMYANQHSLGDLMEKFKIFDAVYSAFADTVEESQRSVATYISLT